MRQKIRTFIIMTLIAFLLIVISNEFKNRQCSKNDVNNITDSEKAYDLLQVSDDGNKAYMYSFHMGTVVSAEVYGKESEQIGCEIADIVQDIDRNLLSVREETSELYKLNESLGLENVSDIEYKVSPALGGILSRALDICRDSDGALDITLRPIALLWGIDSADERSFVVPSKNDIDSTLQQCGYSHLKITEDFNLSADCNGIQIDMGAVGKGYALDEIKYTLDKFELSGATVSVGGSVMVYGSKADGTDWKVGIRNPFGTIDDMAGYISFPAGTNICVSTSGNYEKYIIRDGVRYHHIFNSHTGYPAESGLSSVTVICSAGIDSDALSTACFALGYENSLPLLKKYNADAIFIDNQKNITITDGIKNIFTSYLQK